MLRWLFVILAAAAIFFLTYQKLTTNVWGLTAFLCQLLAVIELAFGLQFVEAGGETFLGSGQAEGGRLFYNYSAPADDFLSNRSDRYCRTGGNGTACPG